MKLPDDAVCVDGPLDGQILPLRSLEYHYRYDLDISKLPWTWKVAIYKPGWYEDEICWIFSEKKEGGIK